MLRAVAISDVSFDWASVALTCGVPTIEAAKWCHGGAIPERTRCTRWTSSHAEPWECLGGESVEYFFVRFWLRLLISGSKVRVLDGPPSKRALPRHTRECPLAYVDAMQTASGFDRELNRAASRQYVVGLRGIPRRSQEAQLEAHGWYKPIRRAAVLGSSPGLCIA
jgi:hypothetical protein